MNRMRRFILETMNGDNLDTIERKAVVCAIMAQAIRCKWEGYEPEWLTPFEEAMILDDQPIDPWTLIDHIDDLMDWLNGEDFPWPSTKEVFRYIDIMRKTNEVIYSREHGGTWYDDDDDEITPLKRDYCTTPFERNMSLSMGYYFGTFYRQRATTQELTSWIDTLEDRNVQRVWKSAIKWSKLYEYCHAHQTSVFTSEYHTWCAIHRVGYRAG